MGVLAASYAAAVTQDEWDTTAATFDDEPDHGLTAPATRSAWRDLLVSVLPAAPARVADLGCGTGTLTRLLTDQGYIVDGLELSRHVLWAMEDPENAFARWVTLLKPAGTVALIEGSWSTGAGLTAARVEQLMLRVRDEVSVTPLTQPIYWGKTITDERYIAVSHR